MSETETWTGIAKIIAPREGEDLEDLCKRIFESKGEEKKSYYDNYTEALCDGFYKEFALADGVLYDITGMKEFEYDDICEASRIDSNSVNMTLKFYNGGTCFREMFEEAIAKLNKTQPA